MKEMNVLYCIDETKKDYSRYLGVSILSLLDNNKDENIHIYILSKYIEAGNKKELIRIVNQFGKKITFSKEGEDIIPDKFKNILCLKGGRPLAAYYRWFFLEKFDIKDRLLYLDCDTIVNKNLSKIYNSDFEGNVYICNLDIPTVRYYNKIEYGLNNYVNTGVYLMNIDAFKDVDMYAEVIKCNSKYGDIDYVDQGYTNFIFNGKIKLISNLQYIANWRWLNSNFTDYFVFHTVRKPNDGRGFCPKRIEVIFNNYLEKTKWKSYIGLKKKIGLIEFIGRYYVLTYTYIEFITYKLLGDKYLFYLSNFFIKFGEKMSYYARKWFG